VISREGRGAILQKGVQIKMALSSFHEVEKMKTATAYYLCQKVLGVDKKKAGVRMSKKCQGTGGSAVNRRLMSIHTKEG